MSIDHVIKSRVLNKPLPSADHLRECFMYDPETGVLTWKERPREHFAADHAWRRFNVKHAGGAAGWVADKKGYRRVTVNCCDYKVTRVVWKLMTGEEPPHEIDHKDRDCANNRWSNLRAATSRQQSYNRLRTDNSTGYRGVAPHGRKWRAMIKLDGVSWASSYFDTPEEASTAYEKAAERLHGEFYRKPQDKEK